MFTAPRIVARQASTLTMTPELRRAIGLLSLANPALGEELARAAALNPALVLHLPAPDATLSLWPAPAPAARPPAPPRPQVGIGGGLAEALGVAGSPGLQEHLAAELRLLLRDPEELAIGQALAQAVSPWGWLDRSLDEIAAETAVPVARVAAVLARAQQIDPAGLLARDLRECLWLQVQDCGLLTPLLRCVLDNLPLLGAGRLAELAQRAGATEAEVVQALQLIRSLDPKPGLRFDPAPPPPAEPDILVRRRAGGWAVSLNRSTLPDLQIDAQGAATVAQRRDAELLVRALARRNETLLRLAGEIVQRQAGWLEAGPARLAPMSFATLAAALGLHETTVGRLAAGRMMATPRGTVSLRALCSPAIATRDGGAVSAVALRARLAALIAAEGLLPLSDARLVECLAAEGLLLARRTVAKYRAQMGISSAAARAAAARGGRV